MGFYQNIVLPRLVHHSMTNSELLPFMLGRNAPDTAPAAN